MNSPSRELNPHVPGASRRDGPRLQIEAVINGSLSSGSLRLNLEDLGFGGFAVESPICFDAGTRHEFRFVTLGGVAVLLKADAVHSRPTAVQDGMQHYVTGFKYAVTSPDDQRSIDILLDAANSPLEFL